MAISPNTSPGFLILRLGHLIRTEVSQALSDYGLRLSTEEHSVLMVVADQPAPIRVVDLAKQLMRDPTTVKRQLNALLEQELVVQTTDPSDRRVVLLLATPKGHDLIRDTTPVTNGVRARALAGLSEDELSTLINALNRMISNLQSNGDD